MISDGSDAAEFRRGWKVVFAGLIGIASGVAAMPFFLIGPFTIPLTQEFGWSRSEVHGATLVISVVQMMTSPIAGTLIDRYGYRRIALISYAIFAVLLACIGGLTNSISSFYALIFLTSLAGGGTGPLNWSRGIIAWFEKRQGLALGIAFAGTGLFSALGPGYATWLIREVGWRWAFVGLAALPAFIALPLTYAFLHRPQTREPDTGPRVTAAARAALSGITAREALAGYKFWAIGLGIYIVSVGVGGMTTHLVPMLSDHGIPAQQAAWLAGIQGIALIAGRVGSGYLADRIWAPSVAAAMFILPILSCFALANPGVNAPTMVAIVIVGLAMGADVSLLAFLVNRYFGRKAYGLISGLTFVFYFFGNGTGSLLFGRVFDRTHSYDQALHLAPVGFVISSLLFLTLGRYPVFAQPPVYSGKI